MHELAYCSRPGMRSPHPVPGMRHAAGHAPAHCGSPNGFLLLAGNSCNRQIVEPTHMMSGGTTPVPATIHGSAAAETPMYGALMARDARAVTTARQRQYTRMTSATISV